MFATEVDYVLTLFEGALSYKDIMEIDRPTMRNLIKARIESSQSRRKSSENIDKIVADYTKQQSKGRRNR